ncbi:hypothetical protein A2495_01285 [Candidatus Curtissbacteria bacterium RIFOXYC12_FULL_41_11]|nr:MAG: hypothetical protein A2495_01285 [Candidatus Curtissbacteria bacterium RIFOXYC12_FULL_41_11]
MLIIILLNILAYFYFFTTFKLKLWPQLEPKDIFTLQYGILKLALVSLISYGIAFSSRSYSINSSLAVNNLHKKNVAETLTDFLASDNDPNVKVKMIEQGTEAIFKHLATGYISKNESKDDGPIVAIINKFLKSA